ncbi:MAG: Anaerobic glycerol-3-phosphate dehydrogenase subunit B [Actinobacteria bacterium]|nr:Anaerobic glycerol-3-phosphate dehydrogenase subunit B [Actinomycetota bacterium]
MSDILIIGSGISGLMAAIKLAREHRVKVVSSGYGYSSLSTGNISFLNSSFCCGDVISSMGKLLKDHLYRVFDLVDLASIPPVVDILVSNQDGQNRYIPTAGGFFYPCYLVQRTMLKGDLEYLKRRRVGVLHSHYLADSLKYVAEQRFGVSLDVEGYPYDQRRSLWEQIKELRRAEVVGIPPLPVIDPDLTHRHIEELEESTDKEIFEYISLNPSYPALRLLHSLRKAALQAGASLEAQDTGRYARIVGSRTMDNLVEAVYTLSCSYQADYYVLATGNLISGGLETFLDLEKEEVRAKEPIFGLPVIGEPEVAFHLAGDSSSEVTRSLAQGRMSKNVEDGPIRGTGDRKNGMQKDKGHLATMKTSILGSVEFRVEKSSSHPITRLRAKVDESFRTSLNNLYAIGSLVGGCELRGASDISGFSYLSGLALGSRLHL